MRRFNQLNHRLVLNSINPQDVTHVVAQGNVQSVMDVDISHPLVGKKYPAEIVVDQGLAKSVVAPVNLINVRLAIYRQKQITDSSPRFLRRLGRVVKECITLYDELHGRIISKIWGNWQDIFRVCLSVVSPDN